MIPYEVFGLISEPRKSPGKKSPGVVGVQLQQKHNVPSKLSLL